MLFVLRDVQEQHDLHVSQLVCYPSDQAIYSKDVRISKNNQHRFKDCKVKNKKVRSYAQPGSEKCLVTLLDTYLSKLPQDSTFFYMRPLEGFPEDPSTPEDLQRSHPVTMNWRC